MRILYHPLHTLLLAGLVLCALLLAQRAEAAIEVRRVVSPGGIEIWLAEDHTVPVVALRFLVPGGTALDPPARAGLANLTAAMLDEGAGELDAQAFAAALEDEAIRIGFGADRDVFHGQLQTLAERVDRAAELMRLALTAPRFDDAALDRIKASALVSIRSDAGDPDWVAWRVLYNQLFAGHPYVKPPGGTPETIAAITADDMRQLLGQRLVRRGLLVVAAGAIDAGAVGRVVDGIFGGLPEGDAPAELPAVALPETGRTVVARSAVPQSVIVVAQPGLERSDPDWYAARVMNHILGGGGFSARLMEEIREKRGLAYGAYSYLSVFDRAEFVFGGSTTANGTADEVLAILRAEWTRMQQDGATEQEVADAKTYLTGSLPLELTSTASIAEFLLDMRRYDLGIDYLKRMTDYIEVVTVADVNRVAARLLAPERLTVVVAGQPEDVPADIVVEGDPLAAAMALLPER